MTAKIVLPALFAVLIGLIYMFYFAPTDELGSFDKYASGSEINTEIQVKYVKSKGIEFTGNGRALFYTEDIDGRQVQVTVPAAEIPEGMENAEVLNMLGHMHGNTYTAARISIVK